MKVPLSARNFASTVPFACFWQCSECGFQVGDDQPSAKGGYRWAEETSVESSCPSGACPSCGDLAWASLREGGVVEALIEQDSMRQSTRGDRRTGLIKLLSLFAWGGMGTAISYGTDALILAPLALGTFCVFVHAAYTEFVNGKRAPHPNAWSYALEPRGASLGGVEGAVRADRRLVAPLSGRSCVAYELGVRRDAAVDDEDWSWTLLEQRSAELEVAGRKLGAGAHLRLRRQLLAEELSEDARTALRRRGIDPTRPGYTFFETIVRPEALLRAEERADGWVVSAL